MPQLLLELFSEEIPARMQAQAGRDLARLVGEKLAAAGLKPDSLTTYAGPRRLTLVAEGLPAAAPDRSDERKGPRVGAPEQAMAGFLRSTGLTQDQLIQRDGVWYAVIESKGRPTPQIVAEAVESTVRAFPWPKSMTWGEGRLRWVRPLKRILCVFDGEIVPFNIDGIESGDRSQGHRFMGDGQSFASRDFAAYAAGLAARYVVLDAAERRAAILEKAKALCDARGLELVEDEGLLDEVTGLAEWPTPILGDMDPAFLDLPAEVIRTSMRTHQKYFAVRDPKTGGLAPHFVTVANIEAPDGGAEIARGNAKVLSARLSDARFFWDEDRKVPLEARLEKLKGVTFHAKLGTMFERVERIEALAREIAPLVGADVEQAGLAARLAKADLATGMVGEFPELQGVMGRYYLLAESEPLPLDGGGAGVGVRAPPATDEALSGAGADHSPSLQPSRHTPIPGPSPIEGEGRRIVADAIRDHYRPQGPSDAVPTAPVSVAVALADKLDTLVGFFAIGEKPTGSKDPFALRRAALGVIRSGIENRLRMPLRKLIQFWILIVLAKENEKFDPGLMLDYEWDRLPDIDPEVIPLATLIDRDLFRILFVGHGELDDWIKAVQKCSNESADLEILETPGSILGKIFKDAETNARALRPVSDEVRKYISAVEERRARVLAKDWFSNRTIPLQDEILAFFADRLKVLLRDQGKRHDLVDAVFALGDDDLVRIVARVEALSSFLATEDGANLLAGYKRATNILKAEEKKGPLPEGEPAGRADAPAEEAALLAALGDLEPKLAAALSAEDFEGAMRHLAGLRAPVDAFFDKVLVNDPDPAVRENRLRLLRKVRAAMGQVADFGLVTG